MATLEAIYFDLDGTIAGLYDYPNWLDLLHNEDTTPYEQAAPLTDMRALNTLLENFITLGITIGVISWSAMGGSKEYNRATRKAKREWVTKYLPCVSEFHVVKYGTPKHKVRKLNHSILVDDNAEVRAKWKGATIDASNPVNTLNELEKLLVNLTKTFSADKKYDK